MTNKIKMPVDTFYQLNELKNKQFECLMNPLETMGYLRDREGFEELKQWIYQNDNLNLIMVRLLDYIYGGDDIFEIEKPKKYVVRSINHDGDKHYKYLIYSEDTDLPMYEIGYDFDPIVKFNTREEAEKWINPQTEVVEVEE